MFPKTVAVIGAGISGLCAAYWLRKAGTDVVVLERADAPGGTIRTIREKGWLIENGPNSSLETTPLLKELFQELGILAERIYGNDEASRRYIVKNGRLRPLPMDPLAFLGSRLWSVGGKLRLLAEPFAGRALEEESVARFVERRLGREFLDYAINPFVAGVYAGDPAKLSVRSAFPKLYALEEKYGGLMVGALRSRRERKQRGEVAKDRARLFSFTAGMQVFPDALAAALGSSLRLNADVLHVVPVRAGKFPVFTIAYNTEGARETLQADAVIFAAPAYATAEIIRPIDPGTSAILDAVSYPPVAEVYLGFRSDAVGRALDGFGFLVPEVEHRNILGTIWSSTLFPLRAPEGHVATTSFVGGARQPDLVARGDDELVDLVLSDLKDLMGVAGGPAEARVIRWDRAIPQYNLGYYQVLAAIDRFEQNFSGAFVCSNYRGGIAVGDCVRSASQIAAKVLAHLALR